MPEETKLSMVKENYEKSEMICEMLNGYVGDNEWEDIIGHLPLDEARTQELDPSVMLDIFALEDGRVFGFDEPTGEWRRVEGPFRTDMVKESYEKLESEKKVKPKCGWWQDTPVPGCTFDGACPVEERGADCPFTWEDE